MARCGEGAGGDGATARVKRQRCKWRGCRRQGSSKNGKGASGKGADGEVRRGCRAAGGDGTYERSAFDLSRVRELRWRRGWAAEAVAKAEVEVSGRGRGVVEVL